MSDILKLREVINEVQLILKKHNLDSDLAATLFMSLYMRISKMNGFNKKGIRASLDEAFKVYQDHFPD